MLDATFHILMTIWERDNKFESSLTRMIMHPAYKCIIKLGPPVVPLLLRSMEKEPNWWGPALREILNDGPRIPIEHMGNLSEITNDWLAWAKIQKGIKW